MAQYDNSWNIPLLAGREEARSEMVAGQLQAINKVADEFDIEKYHEDILLDTYNNGTTPIHIEEVEEIDFGQHSVIRADLQYGEEEPHIGASYTRDSLSPHFELQVTGDQQLREEMEDQIGYELQSTGIQRLHDFYQKIRGER